MVEKKGRGGGVYKSVFLVFLKNGLKGGGGGDKSV